MAIELIGKIKPKNGGKFALVDAADVQVGDGRLDATLTQLTPVYLLQEEYDALADAGAVEEERLYIILEPEGTG
jgi:hypothetical protein